MIVAGGAFAHWRVVGDRRADVAKVEAQLHETEQVNTARDFVRHTFEQLERHLT